MRIGGAAGLTVFTSPESSLKGLFAKCRRKLEASGSDPTNAATAKRAVCLLALLPRKSRNLFDLGARRGPDVRSSPRPSANKVPV